MNFTPIGHVRRLETKKLNWDEPEIMELIIDREHIEGLAGLEDYSHIHVIFNFNQLTKKDICYKVHPERRQDMPELGVFSTCSPTRPNPIGMTLVELIDIKDNIIRVKGLDTFDKTPILDIKPFMEAPEKYRIPSWLKRLWGEE